MIKRRLDAKDLKPVRAYLGGTGIQLNSPPGTKIVAEVMPASHPQGGGERGIKAHSIDPREFRRGMEEW